MSNKIALKKLGECLSKARRRRGLTMEKLAYEMDLSKGNISELERGMRDPRFTTLQAIAEGLGISLSKLLEDF